MTKKGSLDGPFELFACCTPEICMSHLKPKEGHKPQPRPHQEADCLSIDTAICPPG